MTSRYFPLLFRPFPMFLPCGTTSWRRKTTGGSAGHQETSCFCWCRGSGSSCVNFGIRETSRPTCLPTRCCRPWCCAARRTSKLPSKVMVRNFKYTTRERCRYCKWCFLLRRGCCGLHDVVLKRSAWSTWRHKEKDM